MAALDLCSDGSLDRATLDGLLDRLVTKSVLLVDHRDSGIRFSMLESVRRASQETLDPGERIGYVLAHIQPGQTREALASLSSTWAEIAPGLPFDYTFLDDDLAAFYENEARWAKIVQYATLFALLVACLGLFGLASLAVAQRTKEIGIRKVLGASVVSIGALLSKGFAMLVGVSVLISAPLAYLAGQRWLEGFAYRIDLGPGVFLLAGGLALFVALFAVSVQALRAASADPINALRSD